MGSEWDIVELKKLVKISTEKILTTGIPKNSYVSTDNMLPDFGGIVFNGNTPSVTKTSSYSVNDILFSNIRTYFRKLWIADRNGGCSNDVIVFRPKKCVHPKFLFYSLMDERFIQHTVLSSKGTKMPRGDKSAIVQYKINFPPFPEQKSIAHMLGSLDDKIELNRQMNATLEGMAQALFKSWFVDFDPVIDNALAAGNPIPEAFAARAETRRKALADGTANRDVAKQFPAAFQFTEEMGWIPDGWKISKLKDCTNKIGSGSTPRGGSSAYIDEGIKLVRSQNIYDSSFRWSGLVCITDEAADKLKGVILTERDVLINITGDSILRTCVVDPSVLPARVNQHVAILRPKNYLPKHYLHQYIVRSEYKTYLLGFDAGGSRKAVTKGHLEEAEILLPHYNILDAFSDVVDPFFDHKNKNELQIRTLSSLRDTLLPKLISGEIRIPEAEKLTEEALA